MSRALYLAKLRAQRVALTVEQINIFVSWNPRSSEVLRHVPPHDVARLADELATSAELPIRGHLAYGAVLQELHGFERRVEDQVLVLVPDILGYSMAFFADLHEQVHRLVGEVRLAVYGDGVALEPDYIADDVGYAIQYRLGPFNDVCAMRYPQLVLYRHSLSRGRCGGG